MVVTLTEILQVPAAATALGTLPFVRVTLEVVVATVPGAQVVEGNPVVGRIVIPVGKLSVSEIPVISIVLGFEILISRVAEPSSAKAPNDLLSPSGRSVPDCWTFRVDDPEAAGFVTPRSVVIVLAGTVIETDPAVLEVTGKVKTQRPGVVVLAAPGIVPPVKLIPVNVPPQFEVGVPFNVTLAGSGTLTDVLG